MLSVTPVRVGGLGDLHVLCLADARPSAGPRSAGRSPAAGAEPAPRPESLEGVLVAQLMAGEITRSQYLKAVERLAARENERQLPAVPPEIGPADG